jgi:PTS system nitrogen regulatory IIA component
MNLRSVLTESCTKVLASTTSKKRLLDSLSELIATTHPGLDARALFDQLMVRERLGSTGLGDGVAIPHCRLVGQTEAVGAFVKLDTPLDFDAPDGVPVDLIFVLVVPEHAAKGHLELLAQLAGVFGDDAHRRALRACSTDAELHAKLFELLSAR